VNAENAYKKAQKSAISEVDFQGGFMNGAFALVTAARAAA
jgi:hypothetical protein